MAAFAQKVLEMKDALKAKLLQVGEENSNSTETDDSEPENNV